MTALDKTLFDIISKLGGTLFLDFIDNDLKSRFKQALANGANPNAKDDNGVPLLSILVERGELEYLKTPSP